MLLAISTAGYEFLSTPSVGRATCAPAPLRSAPRYFYPRPPWGGRRWDCCKPFLAKYFYPRPPWGGRLAPILADLVEKVFLSTPSVGRATYAQLKAAYDEQFLSTPSVGRATAGNAGRCLGSHHFYPRPPWGGRRRPAPRFPVFHHFYPRPPWGGRRGGGAGVRQISNFYPRPPWGGRQQKYTKILCIFCAKGTIISPPGGAIRRAAAKQPLQHSTT